MLKNILAILLLLVIMIGGSAAWFYQRSVKYYPAAPLDHMIKGQFVNPADYKNTKTSIDNDGRELKVSISYSTLGEKGGSNKEKASLTLVHSSVFDEAVLFDMSEEEKAHNKKVRESLGKDFFKDRISIMSLKLKDHEYSMEELEFLNSSLKEQPYSYPLIAPYPKKAEKNWYEEKRQEMKK